MTGRIQSWSLCRSSWKISSFLVRGHIVPHEEYGFRHSHSTEPEVLRLTETLITKFNQLHSYSALFSNVEKAFHKVWNEDLIVKLHNLDIYPAMCKLVANFLHDWSSECELGQLLSERKPIGAGVSQSSELSSVFYNVYTANISNQMVNVEILTYADCTALCHTPGIKTFELDVCKMPLTHCPITLRNGGPEWAPANASLLLCQ